MSVWFISDPHIGHAKVAVDRATREQICIDMRDEEGHCIRWHDRILAANWDEIIKPKDQVWILGDISNGSKRGNADALLWLANRSGEKHLVPGNHDPCHPMHRDAHKHQRRYLESGFQSVQAFARRRIAGQQVLLSHFPYVGDHTPEDRATQYRLRDEGLWLLHGHTHSSEARSGERQIHVGVDAWNLRPVHLDELAMLMES